MDEVQFWGIIALVIWLIPSPISLIASRWKDKQIEREKEKFKETYSNRVELEAKGVELLKAETEKLRKENENLRIAIKTLQNKPGRAELRQLYVYDSAISYVLQRLPQFLTTWQEALKYGEEEMIKKETGSTTWLTKIFKISPNYEIDDLPSDQKQISGS